MNKNFTALILIVLAIGIYFTFTKAKVEELNSIKAINAEYKTALDNADILLKARDRVTETDNEISAENNERLEKILPDNVDNVQLIIDVKDNIAARHGLFLRGIKTTAPEETAPVTGSVEQGIAASLPTGYGALTLSFSVTTTYQKFIAFLQDLETSLRVMDVALLTVSIGTTPGMYDFNVELKTYWLKQ